MFFIAELLILFENFYSNLITIKQQLFKNRLTEKKTFKSQALCCLSMKLGYLQQYKTKKSQTLIWDFFVYLLKYIFLLEYNS